MSKKEAAASFLARLPLKRQWLQLHDLLSPSLTVLAYHRVCDVGDEEMYPYDPELVSASPAEFAWQMATLRDLCNLVTFNDVIAAREGRGTLPRRAAIVTFDDGFDDNFLHAWPVLRSLGMPATFFVSTGYIGGTETYWYESLSHLLFRVAPGNVDLAPLPLTVTVATDTESRRIAYITAVEALKGVTDAMRRECLVALASRYPDACPPANDPRSRPMSWQQVVEMAQSGMEISSHTVSHPILSQLDDQSLMTELTESQRSIREKTGQASRTLCYPVGMEIAFDERVIAAARLADYALGISYLYGGNRLSTLAPYAVRRLHVERYTSRDLFVAQLLLPTLMC